MPRKDVILRPHVDEELKERMEEIGNILSKVFEHYGFCLYVFDFGNSGMMNYISNAKREHMIEAMKEFIKVHEVH